LNMERAFSTYSTCRIPFSSSNTQSTTIRTCRMASGKSSILSTTTSKLLACPPPPLE
jgi:hypothetical protein